MIIPKLLFHAARRRSLMIIPKLNNIMLPGGEAS
jgi:hypothetical protein